MKEALDKSHDLQKAFAEFSKIHRKRTAMKETLQSNTQKKRDLIKKKNELIESFGEGPEDTKTLEGLVSELNLLDEANV